MSTLAPSLVRSPGSKPVELPWLDYGSTAVPDNHELILWWAQYLWLSDGNFKAAFQRVADHFITTVQFPDLDTDEENAYEDLFLKHLNYRRELKACADDFLCYGNLFVSLYLPFKRTMVCRGCGFEEPINRAPYDIDFDATIGVTWKRRRNCPHCGDSRPFLCKDRKDPDISKVRLKRYSPFSVQLAMNPFSQRKDIYWKIPQTDRRDILSKAPIFIEDTPLKILEAVALNGDLKFDEEHIFHLDETVISGMETRGWGIPRSIANFRAAWLSQIINRADQAIAMDYTLGMRMLSPAQTPGGGDPMITHSMENFVGRVNEIIKTHRSDPTTIHTVPYPLNYQFAGGEGENLLPADKLKFRQQEFLNQCGIPLEYHSMSLTTQAAPMALQLFEIAWQSIPALYNQILAWIVKVTARNFGLEETNVVMQRTTIAYDEARKQVLAQLMAANQISPQTALEPFGVDAEKEVEKVFKHQDHVQKVQREHEEQQQKDQEMGAVSALAGAPTPSQMAQAAQGGGAAGGQAAGMAGGMGGLPGSGGGQGDATLRGMSEQADQIAGQLVSMPEYDRKQQLKAIRESSPDLHALVTSKMEKLRGQAASQGQQQMLASPPAGGAPPAQ
jgi:hypothetical protein